MLKWGIIGLGKIAHQFAHDLELVDENDLHAVASRKQDKADLFAESYHVDKAYGSYEAILEDDEVDIVYIATPHSMHADLALKAMASGKHVLCEKPIAVNATQVEAMIAASKENNVFLMEALWTRFNPTFDKALELIQKGEIGEIQSVFSDFYFPASSPLAARLHTKDLAGGALLDIGIYPVFLAYVVLGIPLKTQATATFFNTGVDAQTSAIMSYENAHATVSCGFNAQSDMVARVFGSEGSILIDDRWHESEAFKMVRNGIDCLFHIPKKGRGYTHEIEECSNCIKEGAIESSRWSHQNSLDLIGMLDTIREEIGLKYPFE